jgi:hypothetical protein
MDRDSKEFKDKVREVVEIGKRLDELRVAVLKAHAVVEGILDSFIEVSVFHPQHLDLQYTNFHTKASVAQSLCLDEDKNPLWDVLWALNQLRNKVAHNAETGVIDEKMKILRTAYMKTVSGQRAEEAKKFLDTKLLEEASYDCGGFLGMSGLHARSRRAVIDED